MKTYIDNETMKNIESSIAQGWSKTQAITDSMPDMEQVPTTSGQYAAIGFVNMEQVRELAKKFNLSPVVLQQRDGECSWRVVGTPDDKGLSRIEDYTDDPNYTIFHDAQQVEDERKEAIDTILDDYARNTPDAHEERNQAIETANDNYDELLRALKTCDDDEFLVVYGHEVDNYDFIPKYSMQYHDTDVTTFAVGLIEK